METYKIQAMRSIKFSSSYRNCRASLSQEYGVHNHRPRWSYHSRDYEVSATVLRRQYNLAIVIERGIFQLHFTIQRITQLFQFLLDIFQHKRRRKGGGTSSNTSHCKECGSAMRSNRLVRLQTINRQSMGSQRSSHLVHNPGVICAFYTEFPSV